VVRLDALRRLLAEHGQDHLVEGVEELDPSTRERFLRRLGEVEWDELEDVAEPPKPEDVRPAAVVTLEERRRRPELLAAGEDAYARGAVAVVMVAGGQGTRLGFHGPKGCFPLAPHSGKTIYQWQAEKVISLSRRVERDVPFLVMTSAATEDATRAFFARHARLGLADGQLSFFVQGTVPSLDRSGKALLARPGLLLENPDGHGGAFTALARSGELDRLRAGGVELLVYIQVDNILAPVDDPELVGLALLERADVVTKVIEKAHPDEKLGHLVTSGGRDLVVEYTELTPEETRARTTDGELVYRWGSPAMHCWSLDFFSRLSERGFRLPLHRSAKPLKAWVDGHVRDVDGFKYERFIFDLIPEAERSLGMEIDRDAEFAPVKNADGADSPRSAVELAHRQYVRWLEAAGVAIRLPDCDLVEISPLLAATEAQLVERWDGRFAELTRGAYLE
jgi:UDP-N-acetylglucosamine/UDP-N-acetylgalactosamine diphosphorylase